jgi:hypothetical protein
MQNENVKKGQILSQRSSEEVLKLANDYFSQISYGETDDILKSLVQTYIDQPSLVSIPALSDVIYHINLLSSFLREANDARVIDSNNSKDSDHVAAKPMLRIGNDPTPVKTYFTMETDLMDDGSFFSIKRGQDLECEHISLQQLERGFNCVFVLKNGAVEARKLTTIDHESELLIVEQLNPRGRTVYSFQDIDHAYLIL